MASAVIFATRTVSGNQPDMRRLAEDASQTFLAGVPVEMNTSTGGINEWDGTTVARGIAGISKEAASNLTTVNVPETLHFGTVPNQSAAVNIPRGAPLNDGKVAVEIANDDTVFFAQVGPATTAAITDVGKYYGMTKDSDNHWYVDKTKSTQGNNTVCVVVKLHDTDPRGVYIRFQKEAQQEVV